MKKSSEWIGKDSPSIVSYVTPTVAEDPVVDKQFGEIMELTLQHSNAGVYPSDHAWYLRSSDTSSASVKI